MGCAIVATDCPSGPRKIVRDGLDGLLVPVEDVGALTSAFDRLTEQARRAEELARAAVDVRPRFAAERILPQWEELISSVLKRGANKG